jgi:septal ring factor EnvC (AmiA/AmiB activator)
MIEESPEKQPRIIEKQEKYEYNHRFSESEIHDFSIELAQTVKDIAETESEIKSFKEDLKNYKAQMNLICAKISDGFERVFKLCRVEIDFAKNEKRYFSRDDKRLVHTEKPIPETDRQLEFSQRK